MKFFAQSSPNDRSLAGTWSGTLGGGAAKLRILLNISKSGDAYSGSLNSLDQGAVLPMFAIRLDGGKVHFEIKAVGGVYDGTLDQDAKSITGTWVQTGVPPQPLSFQRGAPPQAESSGPPPGPEKMALPPQLDISASLSPTAFEAGGKWNLVYELRIANRERWYCKLTRLEVVSADAGHKSLATFDAAYLDTMVTQAGRRDVAEPSNLPPGSFAVVYVWVTLDRRADVPSAIAQRLSEKIGTHPDEFTLETAPTPIHRNPVVVISPPLTGDNWLAGNGPSNTSVHRRALLSLGGRSYISQRFAIDWVRLYPDGKTFRGDRLDNSNYRAYGAEIHAVADGVVTEVKDGIPQNTPGPDSRAVPITLQTIGGNHVILRIGEGLYAFYAHMQPGSIRVKIGDTVRRGQILGLVGNTGNSTEPHLHFDICDASSMLACEGLPYAFASFEVQGRGWGWKSSESKEPPVKHEGEMPLEGDVVRFNP